MAQTARLADTAASLRKLAARLETLADEREREGG
jgi:hypothetical protein